MALKERFCKYSLTSPHRLQLAKNNRQRCTKILDTFKVIPERIEFACKKRALCPHDTALETISRTLAYETLVAISVLISSLLPEKSSKTCSHIRI